MELVASDDNSPANFFRGLLPIERIFWQRIPAPVLGKDPDPGAWDHLTTYYPVIARNLDRTVYKEGSNFLMYYTANSNETTDLDQGGLARSTNLDRWTREPSNPVLPLGGVGDPDAGDAQITSVYHDGSQFILYYQGNATAPDDFVSGDDVTVCLATSADGLTMNKQGRVLTKGTGPDGDAQDMYRPTLIPSGHDGLPKLLYSGQNADGLFGLMAASSNGGGLLGPWTKVSNDQLLNQGELGLFFIDDAWYEDGLYHILYIIGGSSPGGIWYATSPDILNWTIRRQVLPRNPGNWDAGPTRASFYQIDGTSYLFYDGGGSVGIGYSFGVVQS